jgi:hypothetical protein
MGRVLLYQLGVVEELEELVEFSQVGELEELEDLPVYKKQQPKG